MWDLDTIKRRNAAAVDFCRQAGCQILGERALLGRYTVKSRVSDPRPVETVLCSTCAGNAVEAGLILARVLSSVEDTWDGSDVGECSHPTTTEIDAAEYRVRCGQAA